MSYDSTVDDFRYEMSDMYYNFIFRLLFILRLLNNQRDYIDRKGVHVVVGHYIGDSVDPMKTPNITKGTLRNA